MPADLCVRPLDLVAGQTQMCGLAAMTSKWWGKLIHASKHFTIFSSNVAIAVRRVPSILAVLVVAVTLAACATRPESGFLSPVAENTIGATDHTLLIATTREQDARPGTFFNGERGRSLHYAALTVSIPPTHIPGKIEWASTPPGNPAADFVVRDEASLDGDKAFVQGAECPTCDAPEGKPQGVRVHSRL
jgi:hypothetical protein